MTTQPTARTGLSAPLRWLLVASLALNLMVAGLVLGHSLVHQGPGRGPRPMDMSLGPIAKALGADDRRAILAELRGRGDLRAPGRQERRAVMVEVVEALRAEPFDEPRARTALEAQAGRIDAVERALRDALLLRLATLDVEEREALAERIEADAREEIGPRD